MTKDVSLADLSRWTGESEDRLVEWQSKGMLGSADRFEADDIERVKLLHLFLRRGISVNDVSEAMRSGQFDWYLEGPFRREEENYYSMGEAAERAGMTLETMQRVRQAMGSFGPDDTVGERELLLIEGWSVAAKAGVPEDAMVEMIRVYADNLGRVAEAEQRVFRFYVQRPLEAGGTSPAQILERSQALADQLIPLLEPIIDYFHRRGLATAAREDIVMSMAEHLGLVPPAESPAELHMAIVFVDLSSFTPLTGEMGDVAAAQVLERFSAIVRNAAAASAGRVVKQIGDAFMLVFSEPRSAVACALEIESRTASEPQFPATRSGIHWGPVLYREGDYVGSNVNIASRIADAAERHQVLVTAEVRKGARDLPGVEFVRVGKRRLKGVAGDVELFAAHGTDTSSGERTIDPVCGTELSDSEVAVRLSLEGETRAFCSEACLRKFVVSPQDYAPRERSGG
jgi:adenylate cyclase